MEEVVPAMSGFRLRRYDPWANALIWELTTLMRSSGGDRKDSLQGQLLQSFNLITRTYA